MLRRLPLLALAGVLLVRAPFALAWNAAGHRLTAAIAWQQMSEPARRECARLLARHPEAAVWEKEIRAGDEHGLGLFVEASTWADAIRRDPRFYDAGREAPTTRRDGYADMARHRSWHFVNLAVGSERHDSVPEGEIGYRIGVLANQVGDRRLPDADRAYALTWLVHLVGDIHQPLHVATRFDARGLDDGGGNGVTVIDPGSRRHPVSNLHAWWDEIPGPPWLRGPRLLAAAESLSARIPAERVRQGEVRDWRDESHELAATVVYPEMTSDADEIVLDSRYRETAHAVAGQRIAAAGYRLGRLLDRLLARPRQRRRAGFGGTQ